MNAAQGATRDARRLHDLLGRDRGVAALAEEPAGGLDQGRARGD